MTKRIVPVWAALAVATAFARPEITWSVMHPTPLDADYMARV